MQLRYLIAFQDAHLVVLIEETGSRRVLYWDTLLLTMAEEDKEALFFFRKILTRFSQNLDTLIFHRVLIAPHEMEEAMRSLSKTGKVFYEGRPLLCDWRLAAQVHWEGDDADRFTAYLQYREEKIPLEACSRLFPRWCIWNQQAFPIHTAVSWQWIELFRQGSLILEGSRKKRFLEEAPLISWKTALPCLLLTDASGSFANLRREHPDWEKDLLEAGYSRKRIGQSLYFIPLDQACEALLLLLDVGWEIFLLDGKRLYRQTGAKWRVDKEKDGIVIRSEALFGSKQAPLKPLKPGKLWIELDGSSAGLLDRTKGEAFEGEWIGDALYLPKEQAARCFPLLEQVEVEWEESLLETIRGLRKESWRKTALPGPLFKGELLPHQQKGVDWLQFLYAQGFSGLLADEMGLGKTVQVLAFFSRMETSLPVLIVAPASLLFHWREEIRRFLPEASVQIRAGSGRAQEGIDHQYVITSYAMLRIDGEFLSRMEWEVIVLDESSAIKTAATQTAQAACRLKGRFRIALNGTPIENRPEEMGSQFQFLMPRLIRNIHRDAKKIQPFIMRRKKDELELPEKMEQTVWVEMESEQALLYQSHEQGIKAGLMQKIARDGVSIHRMEVLEAILRLRQISTDPRLLGSEIRGSKIERLLSDVQEALGENRKVLIYSQFTSMLSLIGKELGAPFLYLDGSVPLAERADRVRRFQEDPKMPLFLLSLKAGGVGLNLTAADYVFLFDPWWNEAVENQAIDRAHRIGRKNTVIAKRYLSIGSVEEKMLRMKEEKRKCAEALLDNGEGFSWTEDDLLYLFS